ncbi:MAG TPA: hypothetical protein VH475_16755 [Tepidisphaeraceae bacterium]|jgi:hypothetical protein
MLKNVLVAVAVLAVPALIAHAEAKDDVQAACKKLADAANYSWKTTVEGGFNSTTEGKTQKDGATTLSLTFGDNTREVVIQGTKAALKTDDGWKAASELQDEQGPQRFLARMATNFKAPAVQAQEIADKTKELKKADDVYTADLTEAGAKELMSFRRGGNQAGPQISNAKGTIKFWVKDGVLSKFEYNVQGSMTINNEDRDINRTTTTEIKDVGSTKVEVPADAKAKLQ